MSEREREGREKERLSTKKIGRRMSLSQIATREKIYIVLSCRIFFLINNIMMKEERRRSAKERSKNERNIKYNVIEKETNTQNDSQTGSFRA